MKALKKKSLIEILELISDYSEIKRRTILVNYEIEMIGRLADFKALRNDLSGNFKPLTKFIYEMELEISQPITSIEVYNYFKKLTDDFSQEQTRDTLSILCCFRDMVLEEELYHLSKLEYINNNWPIPTYIKTGISGTFEYEDVKKMRHKVFPLHGLLFYEAISLLRSKINLTTTESSNGTQQGLKPTFTLSNLITHERNYQIVNGIKISFKNIKGKRLKLLLLALQELNLIPKERIAKAFHNSCKKDFDWDIASYTAMNDYPFNNQTDQGELSEIIETIKSIINQK